MQNQPFNPQQGQNPQQQGFGQPQAAQQPGFGQAHQQQQQAQQPGSGQNYQQYGAQFGQTQTRELIGATPGARFLARLLESVLVVVTLGIGWLIWAAILAGDGYTPAKKIMGQRVVDSNTGKPVGFANMLFMRGLVGGFVAQFATIFTLGVILFMPFWDKKNQNIWDKVSSTYVIQEK